LAVDLENSGNGEDKVGTFFQGHASSSQFELHQAQIFSTT